MLKEEEKFILVYLRVFSSGLLGQTKKKENMNK